MKLIRESYDGGDHGVVVLTLKGEFDSFVTSAFADEIQELRDKGVQHIALNMRLVKFVNSTALGAMIRARKACKADGGDVVVSQASKAVREAMEVLGLDRVFSIFDDDEAAVAGLG